MPGLRAIGRLVGAHIDKKAVASSVKKFFLEPGFQVAGKIERSMEGVAMARAYDAAGLPARRAGAATRRTILVVEWPGTRSTRTSWPPEASTTS